MATTYLNAPDCTITFTGSGFDNVDTDSASGVVQALQGGATKPATFYDGGSDTSRYVFWGPLSGSIVCQELEFSHSEGVSEDLDDSMSTEDILPSSPFSVTITFGGSNLLSFTNCSLLFAPPGITSKGGDIYFAGVTRVKIWDPDLSASL